MEAKVKQTSLRVQNCWDATPLNLLPTALFKQLKHITANSPPGAESFLSSGPSFFFLPVLNTIVCRESFKMHFSPQRIYNALSTKDKSISRQMVLKDASAVCLRWEASGGRRATVKWNTRLSDSPDVAHKGDAHLPRCQTRGTAKWALAGTREERERGGGGRVNISYWYQTEWYISIRSKITPGDAKEVRESQDRAFRCCESEINKKIKKKTSERE